MSASTLSTASDRSVVLADGRQLAYIECGAPAGETVFHFHGHPGSRLEALMASDAAARAGVRLIGVDRPGMGRSDFKPRRQLLEWADDVVALADELAIDKFGVEGTSGGGPYAAACAFKLADRITACGIVAGLGPIDRFGTRGMKAMNRLQFALARRAPWLLRPMFWLYLGRRRGIAGNEDRLAAMAQGIASQLPASIATDEQLRSDLAKAYLREMFEAFRQGSRGPSYDAWLYVQPWGFELETIECRRVYVWHGERDVHVPVSMGRAVAAAIPGCRATFFPEETHLETAFGHLAEVMTVMAGGRCDRPPPNLS